MRTATVTSTTAAEIKKAQKWCSAHAWKWLFAVAPNPTTWTCLVQCCGVVAAAWLWKSTFLLFFFFFFTITGFKTYHRLFFTLSRRFFRNYVFPAFSQFKISYPQPRSNAVYKSYCKSRFWGLHKSYSNRHSSSLLILDRKREKWHLLLL